MIRGRVTIVREIQTKIFSDSEKIYYKPLKTDKQIDNYYYLNEISKTLLKIAMDRSNLSARAYDRILKVFRTIEDLKGVNDISPEHIGEAIQYRSLDREGWLG